jgi:hypothetical protein
MPTDRVAFPIPPFSIERVLSAAVSTVLRTYDPSAATPSIEKGGMGKTNDWC